MTARIRIVAMKYVPRNFFRIKMSRTFSLKAEDTFDNIFLNLILFISIINSRDVLTHGTRNILQTSGYSLHHLFFPLSKITGQYVCPRILHEFEIESEIMYGRYLHGKQFLTDK